MGHLAVFAVFNVQQWLYHSPSNGSERFSCGEIRGNKFVEGGPAVLVVWMTLFSFRSDVSANAGLVHL